MNAHKPYYCALKSSRFEKKRNFGYILFKSIFAFHMSGADPCMIAYYIRSTTDYPVGITCTLLQCSVCSYFSVF